MTRDGQATAVPQDEDAGEEAVFEAPALLRILWADPQYMPEHLAIWSLKRFGPRASAAVEKLRSANPDAGPGDLERLVIEHQTRVSMTEGAFVGGPFIILIPVAFCAALLSQAQMALEVAAINGYAPSDQMRAADLLVIQGAYGSTEDASAALAKMARDPKRREGKKLPRGSRWSMIKRMAFMLGLMGAAGDEKAEPLTRLVPVRVAWSRASGWARAAPRVGPLHGLGVQKERASDGSTSNNVLRGEKDGGDRSHGANVPDRADSDVRRPDPHGATDRRAGRGRTHRAVDRCRYRWWQVGQRGHSAHRHLRADHARLVRLPLVTPSTTPAPIQPRLSVTTRFACALGERCPNRSPLCHE